MSYLLIGLQIKLPLTHHVCWFATPQVHRVRDIPFTTYSTVNAKWLQHKINKALLPPPPATSLCDLPKEVLEMVINYAYQSNTFYVRATCHHMRTSCDAFLTELFNRNMYAQVNKDPLSKDAIIYRVIVEATQCFRRYEGGIPFLCCIKQVFEKPQVYFVRYLRKYYRAMNQLYGGPKNTRRRFTYSATLMCLLEKFLFKEIEIAFGGQGTYLIRVDIPGIWIVVMWNKNSNFHFVDEAELFVVLAELMAACFSRTPIKRVYRADTCLFIYGYEVCTVDNYDQMPKTTFHLRLECDDIIRDFMFNCLYTDGRNVRWPHVMPMSPFKLNIHCECEEAAKWNCPELYEVNEWCDAAGMEVALSEANVDNAAHRRNMENAP